MNNIAFISLGSDSHANAEFLVNSIKIKCKNFKIIQISRKIDKQIKDTDFKLEYDFKGSSLMIDKLKTLSLVFEKFGSFLFLDSDMIVAKSLNSISDQLKNYDLVFTSRKKNFTINDHFQNIKFPEFTNKTANEVMPFNAGFIGVNSFAAIKYVEETCLKLPQRFHFWYGDQFSQKIVYESKKFKILNKDYKYNYSVKNINQFDEDVYVYHFKGRFKNLMKPFFKKYLN